MPLLAIEKRNNNGDNDMPMYLQCAEVNEGMSVSAEPYHKVFLDHVNIVNNRI